MPQICSVLVKCWICFLWMVRGPWILGLKMHHCMMSNCKKYLTLVEKHFFQRAVKLVLNKAKLISQRLTFLLMMQSMLKEFQLSEESYLRGKTCTLDFKSHKTGAKKALMTWKPT
nr:hypothetical protein Iba_chr07eCG11760 [Ipomoea batatas]